MKKTITMMACMLLMAVLRAAAESASVSGPDGHLTLTVNIENGMANYDVRYDGIEVMRQCPLGFMASMGDFAYGLTFVKSETARQHICYDMNRSKQSHVEKDANVLVVTLQNKQQRQYAMRFCLTDNDIAFRYEMVPVADKVNGQKMSVRILKEVTGFRMPEGTTTFLCPQSAAMIGWKGTKPSYEEDYVYDEAIGTPSKYGTGYTFPCLFKCPATDGNFWVLISETGVDSHYCGSRLSDHQGKGLYRLAFPMAEENNGNGTIEPAFALPGNTPWRTITIGKTLKPIVETTVPWDFVEPLYATQHNYQFGKGTWSWIVWQDPSINYADQVKYIDLAHKMGYRYVLIDNWWDRNIGTSTRKAYYGGIEAKPGESIEDLVRYANSQGVDVFLWHSSSGYWNDIEQGPISLLDNSIRRKQEMRWLHKIGVKGIKVDFFGGDKQETMRLYEDILSDADDNGLMVIFHGCTLPRGWEKMYPNYVGSEAVLASENIFFEQRFCDHEAENTATHPFIRNTVGCMEFGGSFMNTRLGKDNKSGNIRRSTFTHELAQAVLFQNPIQNFAITPENFGNEIDATLESKPAPKLCMDFLRDVPTTWDEVQFIDGYPGKYCILARRHADTWYIAGNNATGKPLTLTLSLPMLKKGDNVTLYSDDMKTTAPQMKQQKISSPDKVKVSMPVNGGFVIVK